MSRAAVVQPNCSILSSSISQACKIRVREAVAAQSKEIFVRLLMMSLSQHLETELMVCIWCTLVTWYMLVIFGCYPMCDQTWRVCGLAWKWLSLELADSGGVCWTTIRTAIISRCPNRAKIVYWTWPHGPRLYELIVKSKNWQKEKETREHRGKKMTVALAIVQFAMATHHSREIY